MNQENGSAIEPRHVNRRQVRHIKQFPHQSRVNYQIRAIPASTNRFGLRKAAVSRVLNRRHGCVIDPSCAMLIDEPCTSYVDRRLRATTTIGSEVRERAGQSSARSFGCANSCRFSVDIG
jgi:hypothetical protein